MDNVSLLKFFFIFVRCRSRFLESSVHSRAVLNIASLSFYRSSSHYFSFVPLKILKKAVSVHNNASKIQCCVWWVGGWVCVCVIMCSYFSANSNCRIGIA